MKSILKICNVSKKFGNFKALKSINLTLQPGEIHGLVGENGAGKSTLLSILYGSAVIRESGGYSGEIFINEKKVSLQTTSQAISLGIGMVHQEFALIPHMTAAENIIIGREKVVPVTRKLFGAKLGFLDQQRNAQAAKAVIKKLNLNIDTKAIIDNLSVNIKQFIEIAREIAKEDLKILILDEPTAALSGYDTERLFAVLKDIASKGTAIIFVSHRLDEVVSLCQNIAVLRDGEIAGLFNRENCSLAELANTMVGRPINQITRKRRLGSKEKILEFKNYSVSMPGENIYDLNLNIYKGEILGIAGL
ncbi:MAG: ATP-binding cassette domain-containing protein [Patescibacteria group bacterium]|nr:ATP-binding cassette domain-containing protein [Patescibacteria group bacterium]